MNYAQMIIPFIGGLALFIYGMNIMAQGLQNAAGSKMKSILEALTQNKLMGIALGALVTAIVQSSSGNNRYGRWFCNAGLMNPDTGHECYHGCQHWYNCNRLAGIQFRMGEDVQPRNHCTSGSYAGCNLDDER